VTQILDRIADRAETLDVRLGMLAGATALGAYLVLVTELMSAFGKLSSPFVAAAWLVPFIVGVWLASHLVRRIRRPPLPLALVVGGLAVLSALVLATGLWSAPNNYDSMTYHLPRVMHWLQSESLSHYYTPITRQLYQPPFAEYAIAQIISLTGTDRLAFLVQWLAFVGSGISASVIARQLGAGRLGQALAAAIFMTAPMAILQGSSTQNDLVLTFWVLVAVVAVLDSQGERWRRSLLAGGAVGLALLTKGTASILLAPFIVWFAVDMVRRHRRAALVPLAVAALLASMLNAGHVYRNVQTFGSPFGDEENGYFNDEHGLGVLVSNASRNLALEVSGSAAKSAVVRLHDALGLDVNDPRTTWPGYQFEPDFNLLEDSAPNPLQILLVVAAILTGAWVRNRRLSIYLAAVIIGFLLFSEILRWQPWHSRLLLPLIALLAPWVASALPRTEKVWCAVLAVVLIAVGCGTAPWNESRPLVGRDSVVATGSIGDVFPRSRPVFPPSTCRLCNDSKVVSECEFSWPTISRGSTRCGVFFRPVSSGTPRSTWWQRRRDPVR
jgi:hypothetical protein